MALNARMYSDPGQLELTTIEDTLYLSMKNDLSFIIDDRMNLYGQQSTYNPNMPVRGLLYFAQLFNKYISAHDLNRYGSTLLSLPTPRFTVFYNGERSLPCREVLQLSDSFRYPDESDVNVTVTMININSDSGDEILEHCRMLREYAEFVAVVRQFLEDGHRREAAINLAVDHCIDAGILQDILLEHRSEVFEMMMNEYDEEKAMGLFKKDGIEEARLADIQSVMSSFHVTLDQAMDALKVPPCEREKYKRRLDAM